MTEDLMKEGCQREWMTVGGNKIEVEPKHEMKHKCGRSPDLADCCVIGLEGARQRGFHIRRMVNEEYVEQDTRWKDELRRKAIKARQKYQLNYAA
jgi:ribosomal protein L13E